MFGGGGGGGRGPVPSYRAQDGLRGKMTHLRHTTRKPDIIIIIIIRVHKRGKVEIKEGPLKTHAGR